VGEFHPDGGRAGKAPGEVRNGEQDQAPRAAFLIAADSNGDSNVSIRKSCERVRVCAGRRDPTHR
jgi:hypothetical protein